LFGIASQKVPRCSYKTPRFLVQLVVEALKVSGVVNGAHSLGGTSMCGN